MFCAFGCHRRSPINGRFVIVVYHDALGGVEDAEIDGDVADVEEFGDTGVCCEDFGFAGGPGGLLLANGFPSDGTASTANYKP